jgi:hypothetical protein
LIRLETTSGITAMRLLLYSCRESEDSKRLEATVHKVIPKDRIELFKSLTELRERLRTPVEPDSIAVLLASSEEELRKMQPLRVLLPEIFVVLVIPDRMRSTIALAHLLLPRFLSQKSDDFKDLGRVLEKICRTAH